MPSRNVVGVIEKAGGGVKREAQLFCRLLAGFFGSRRLMRANCLDYSLCLGIITCNRSYAQQIIAKQLRAK
jgi:hypothetical protein